MASNPEVPVGRAIIATVHDRSISTTAPTSLGWLVEQPSGVVGLSLACALPRVA